MLWMTTSHVHLDRVATPWLIQRFVDPEAEFAFVAWDDQRPVDGDADTVLFGMPGLRLGSHDENGTAFAKVMRGYDLDDDPALVSVERVVAAGVRHALGIEAPADQTAQETLLGAALDVLGRGLGIAFDDTAHIAAAGALYDALYVLSRVDGLPDTAVSEASTLRLPDRVAYLRAALDLT
jgi:hypothetical protein